MHELLLTPSDVLFFRDGRPMDGSLTGRTASWPLPHTLNAALHAALHRAGLAEGAHKARRGRSGCYSDERESVFGSLKSIGPFPVAPVGTWHFPTPADLVLDGGRIRLGCKPVPFDRAESSLPKPLTHALVALTPPAKDNKPGAWMKAEAYHAYINSDTTTLDKSAYIADEDLPARESRIGIGIDPGTQTQDGQKFYTAEYLRLKHGWKLGLLAEADDKQAGDLLDALFRSERHLVVGGQQGACTVENTTVEGCYSRLPTGRTEGFTQDAEGRYLIKWTLLTPAIFPAITGDETRKINSHPGGWLPNWVDPESGAVLLKSPTTPRGESESREAHRARIRALNPLDARLIAALVPKPIPVSGWSLGQDAHEKAGDKSTQWAVPAGAVYYFSTPTDQAARQLAATLNPPACRSSLLGEKGFGLGVCSSVQI